MLSNKSNTHLIQLFLSGLFRGLVFFVNSVHRQALQRKDLAHTYGANLFSMVTGVIENGTGEYDLEISTFCQRNIRWFKKILHPVYCTKSKMSMN